MNNLILSLLAVLILSANTWADDVVFTPTPANRVLVSGMETTGAARGPVFQMFDPNGSLLLSRFVLNPDFTDLQVFAANTTNSVAGEEIVAAGFESTGLKRGPAYQVYDSAGNLLLTRFVLNPDFTEVTFTKIDVNNDGVDEILVVGRESKGLLRGPAFQLFAGNGNLLVSQFALNPDFTDITVFAVDRNGDGDQEIGIGGVETKGLLRGPAYQIFESNGALLLTRFALNPNVSKPTTRIVTLGHEFHGKSTLTAAITKVLYKTGGAKFVPYEDIENPPEIEVQGIKVAAAQVEYETDKARYIHIDCRSHSDYTKLLTSTGVMLDGAVLVVSAADGPMPQTREHIILASQKGIKSIVVYMNKVDLVNDPELLDLVELEIRELLTKFGFNGKEVPVIRGSALMALVGTRNDIGGSTIIELLRAMDTRFAQNN
jgi:hypothetical protein